MSLVCVKSRSSRSKTSLFSPPNAAGIKAQSANMFLQIINVSVDFPHVSGYNLDVIPFYVGINLQVVGYVRTAGSLSTE